MKTPTVTVLTTVYNGAAHLPEAIASILAQTFADFELLVINDGSTDDSLALLRSYDDPRIRLIDQQPNRGIRPTLNRGLQESRGRYVAIMDQDDIAHPRRLELLVERLEQQPALALCGSAIETFGDRPGASWVRHFEPDALRVALLFENPICHPSVMLRRSALETAGLRYPDIPYAEEYALWVALSLRHSLANHREALLRYRTHPAQVSRSRNDIQVRSMDLVIREQLSRLGLDASPRDLILHKMLAGSFNPIPGRARLLAAWSRRLLAANGENAVYPDGEFARQLDERLRSALDLNARRLRELSPLRRLAWMFAVGRGYLLASSRP